MLLRKLLPVFIVFFISSCSPKIEFTASPPVISKGDSVFLKWKIKGEPTLLFDQRKIAHPPNDSLEILEFTLSVEKNGRTKYIKRQVSVLPQQSTDRLVFMTTAIKGDTLFAEGIKDTISWKNFEIVSVSSLSPRALIIYHAGETFEIKKPGVPEKGWAGKSYAGSWKIATLLTAAEKQDHSIIPDALEIEAVIRPQKN